MKESKTAIFFAKIKKLPDVIILKRLKKKKIFRFETSIFITLNAINIAIETEYRFNVLNPETSIKYAVRSLGAAANMSLSCQYQLVSYFLPESFRCTAQPILDVFSKPEVSLAGGTLAGFVPQAHFRFLAKQLALTNSSTLVEGASLVSTAPSAEENYNLLKDEFNLQTKVSKYINQYKTLLKFYESNVLPKTGEALLKLDPALDLIHNTKSNAEYVNTFLVICDLRPFKVCEFLETHADALFKVLPKKDLIQKSLETKLRSNPFQHKKLEL